MRPRFVQVNQPETKKVHFDQARAVLEHRPDIIFLEYPNNKRTPNTIFNKYSPANKPLHEVAKIRKGLKKVLKTHPWAKADIRMWDNIAQLWKDGQQVLVYRVDAPSELTRELLPLWRKEYPSITKDWLWWVRIYLREKKMAENVKWTLKRYHQKENPKVLVLLQSFHWKHVKFLLKNPTQKEIWNYYFRRFKKLDRQNIAEMIKQRNKVFYKYWRKYSLL